MLSEYTKHLVCVVSFVPESHDVEGAREMLCMLWIFIVAKGL